MQILTKSKRYCPTKGIVLSNNTLSLTQSQQTISLDFGLFCFFVTFLSAYDPIGIQTSSPANFTHSPQGIDQLSDNST